MTLTEFLEHLENVQGSGSQFSAKCPAHDDRHNSLSVTEGRDRKILLHCHAGCSAEAILQAMNLTLKDLYPDHEAQGKPISFEKGTPKAEYFYCDENDAPLLKKTRIPTADGKSFFWQYYDGKNWRKGRNGITPPLYNQNAMESDTQIFIVEGEKDVQTMSALGFTTVSLPDGASSRWREEYGSLFQGKGGYILPGNDEAGKKHAAMLAKNLFLRAKLIKTLDLRKKWEDMPEKADISDLYERFGPESAILAVSDLAQNEPVWLPNTAEAPRYLARSAEDFGEDNTRFVWYPFIPMGDYTVLMAEGGTGKTMLCCGIAATLSRGENLPGDTVNLCSPKGNILFISAEDRGELLKKRLIASGADLSRIRILDCTDSEGLNFTDGVEDFRQLILQANPSLVIVDPWHAFLGDRVDINRVNALRPVLQRLSNLSKEAGCGMLLVSHVNKRAQSENANNAATGSVDFINAARSAIRVVKNDDPGYSDQRIIVHTKSNYAPEGKSVIYRITKDAGAVWAGFSEINRSLLEESARYKKTPFEMLHDRQRQEAETDTLAEALRGMVKEGETVNISYEEMRDTFGEDIFGSGQPKRILDRLANTIYVEGIRITTGKSVKYNGKAQNGFSVTRRDPFESAD